MNIARLFASNIIWRGTYLFTSLVLTVAMARYLKAETTGSLFYFISLLTLVLIVVSFSMESSIVYFVSSGSISDGKMQSFAMAYTVVLTALFVPVAFLLFKNGYSFANGHTVMMYAVLFTAGNLLTTFYNSLFAAKGNYFIPNLIFIIVNVLLILFLVYTDKPGAAPLLQHFILVFFCCQLAQGIIAAIVYSSKYAPLFTTGFPAAAQIKKIIVYSGIAYMGNIVFFLVTRLDYWLIDYFVQNDALLGNYIQASRLVQLFQMLPAVLAAAIFPVAAAGHVVHMKESILKLSRIVISSYLLVLLFLVFAGSWLFPFVFGESFSDMYKVFLLLIPGLLSLAMLALIAPYFAATNRLSINLFSAVTGLLVIVPLNLWLIPQMGITGAAIASSAAYTVVFLFSFLKFKKEAGIAIHEMLFVKAADIQFLKNIIQKL